MDWLRNLPIAHRGLHDSHKGIIENSPSAFEAAARAGYAIELDVHLSSDGEVIVFHYATLDPLTEETGTTSARTASELTQITIEGSADTIPTLKDVLGQVAARVPLLIEIKNFSRSIGALEAAVARDLETYYGVVAVQSFNPLSMAWFAKHVPHLRRGQISRNFKNFTERPLTKVQKFTQTHMLMIPISRPQFIAYECSALPSFVPGLTRRLGLPLLAWTVKSEATQEKLVPHADNIIFEGFRPKIPHRNDEGA